MNRDSASQFLLMIPDEVTPVLETDLLVTGAIEGIPFLYLTIVLDSPFLLRSSSSVYTRRICFLSSRERPSTTEIEID